MITFFSDRHELHAPVHEFFRDEPAACFETPARAEFVPHVLTRRGHVQPFLSVWPVRTLRSDVEPTNFTARLGLYSMDDGSPLSAGTWATAKAGADLAASAVAAVQAGARAAFCVSRPPGHHAGADFMGGYCLLNNAAVAAAAFAATGAGRIAVLDVDYQRGNGTQHLLCAGRRTPSSCWRAATRRASRGRRQRR